MPNDKKPKGGMSEGFLPSIDNSKAAEVSGSNKDYDTIPSYLYFIKAVQDGNDEAAGMAIKHVQDVHGPQTATQLAFLGHQMKSSNINDIAKRSVALEANPQMKRLYSMINENPDVVNKFQYGMPQKGGLANSLTGL